MSDLFGNPEDGFSRVAALFWEVCLEHCWMLGAC